MLQLFKKRQSATGDTGINRGCRLEHRAEKWEPVFRLKRCENKKPELATCVGFNAACDRWTITKLGRIRRDDCSISVCAESVSGRWRTSKQVRRAMLCRMAVAVPSFSAGYAEIKFRLLIGYGTIQILGREITSRRARNSLILAKKSAVI